MNTKELKRDKIGYAIQYFREKYNISQGTLCKGLCSVATLSRIETGERDVDAFLLEALLGRMGQTPDKFELILTEGDYVAFQMREEIENLIEQRNYNQASELLDSYQRTININSAIHQQFILRNEAQLYELNGGSIEKSTDLLKKAFLSTVPEFNEKKIKDFNLNNTELNIIISITQRMVSLGSVKEAKEILFQILEYMDLHITLEGINNLNLQLTIMICNILLQEQEIDKALDLCNNGLAKNSNNLKLDYRGELFYIKAKATEAISKRNDDCIEHQNDFLKWYLQAYYVFDFCNEPVKKEEIRKYLQEEYAWVSID